MLRAFLPELQPDDREMAKLARDMRMPRRSARRYLEQARHDKSRLDSPPKKNSKRERDAAGRLTGKMVPLGVPVELSAKMPKPDIKRALLLSVEWIEKMFDDGKVWELRSFAAKRGWFYLLATGGGGIRGHARIVDTFASTAKKLSTAEAYKKHRVGKAGIRTYCKKNPTVWVLGDIVRYSTIIPCKPKPGCVTWVVDGL